MALDSTEEGRGYRSRTRLKAVWPSNAGLKMKVASLIFSLVCFPAASVQKGLLWRLPLLHSLRHDGNQHQYDQKLFSCCCSCCRVIAVAFATRHHASRVGPAPDCIFTPSAHITAPQQVGTVLVLVRVSSYEYGTRTQYRNTY